MQSRIFASLQCTYAYLLSTALCRACNHLAVPGSPQFIQALCRLTGLLYSAWEFATMFAQAAATFFFASGALNGTKIAGIRSAGLKCTVAACAAGATPFCAPCVPKKQNQCKVL